MNRRSCVQDASFFSARAWPWQAAFLKEKHGSLFHSLQRGFAQVTWGDLASKNDGA